MPRERRSKYANDAKDTVGIASQVESLSSSLAQLTAQNLVADIQSKNYKVGDKIFSNLYGGSTWEVKSSVTLEGYAIDFTDEIHIVVNLVGGGTGIAECQLSSVTDYAKQINTVKYAETFAKLKRRQPVMIGCKGDSITYGFNNATGIDRNGQPTNFGDGSTYNEHKQDANPYPKVLQDSLNTVYGTGVVTVNNQGYSGDQVGNGYTRHRVVTGQTLTTMFYGVNDMLYATDNAVNPNKSIDTANRWCIQNFVPAYRKMIIREMLRGSAVVLIAPFKFTGYVGFDTTTYSAAKLIQLYKNAIYGLGKELGVLVVDAEDFIGNYVNSVVLAGVHPTTEGYNIIGKRLSAIFIGNGFLSADNIKGERQITALAFGENLVWSGLTGDNKAGTDNTNSYQAAYPNASQSYDYFITPTSGDVYFSFYLEKDYVMAMPIGILNANGAFAYSLDFGISQPEFKLDVLDTNGYDRTIPDNTINVTSTTTLQMNSPNDLGTHLIIQGKGWHTLKLACTAQSFTFMGIRFFESVSFDKVIKQTAVHGTVDNFTFSNLSILKDGGHYRLCFSGSDFAGGAIKLFLNGNETETNYFNADEGGTIANTSVIVNAPGTGGLFSSMVIDIHLDKATGKPVANIVFTRWSSTTAFNIVRRTLMFNVSSTDVNTIKLKFPANLYESRCELQRF
jgi:lysophospholipase L1-like esterase